MTALGDRLLVVLIAATALGAVLWWVVGFVRAELSGWTRIAGMGLAILLYFVILAGIYVRFRQMDRE